ncbi:hypothetical protein F8388_003168 [Cannabis sativa]|uniref:Uncharacterized protein n=1 Tax=Cannabis sativa TaxID=3483 RepID=A0A7J6ETT5_CANSA|nr:hypothetical protein F8388_003168 [Cannabis sativa]
MSIVSWNVRGLNGDIALRQTKLLLKYHKADVIFFMETKLAEGKQDYMKKCLGFEEGYEVPRNGLSGGLMLLWKGNVEISNIRSSSNHISCFIRLESQVLAWHFCGFYGDPKESECQSIIKDSWSSSSTSSINAITRMVLNKEEDEDYNIIKYVDSLSFVSIVVFLVGLLNRDNEWCSKVEDMTKIITEFYGHTPDSQLILSIPITLYEHDDDWLWHFTSHGHYSVKSGYNLAIGGENLQPSSSNEVMAAWWSAYWAIKIPKKILHFGWKGFHEILPSFSGLFRRQSLSHTWTIWFERNKKSHGRTIRTPHQIKIWISSYYNEICRERNKTKKGVSTGCTSEQSNTETEVNNYKLFVDAGISTPQNVIGFGAVIFSSDKQMKAALSKPLQGIKR